MTVFASDGSDPDLGVEPVCSEDCQADFSEAAMGDPSALPEPFMRTHHAYLHLMLDLAERDFDVIQNSSLHYLPVSLAPFLDIPFVTTLHTPPTPWLESALASHRLAARSTFVSVSRANARSWASTLSVTEVIPNGIDLEAWPFSTSGDPSTVVWSGRLVPEKGPDLAVEAAHGAGKRIVLAGPLDGNGYADGEVLDRLRPGDRYAGHLDQDDLADLVGTAGTFVCSPCWEEPFGLVVAEALACGTPVAAFDRGALREIVDERTGVLAEPGDIVGLADAIGRAGELVRSDCRDRAEAEFSVVRMVDRYEQVYQRLVS